MIFNSFGFIVLFPLIFLCYYLIPANCQKGRNAFLLIISYLLYINWKPVYALVLLSVTISTYLIARGLNSTSHRNSLILVGGALSLSPLLFFKYFNFVNQIIYDALSIIGLRWEMQGLNWAVPIGISFYTFQALGYLMDVYYKRIKSENNFLVYALFISFFPLILSGPINKASLVIPQIRNLRQYFDYSKAVGGLRMMLWGVFMKVVVADRLALYVDTVLPYYMNYTGLSCFVASIFYTIQIYTDFAGYSLMAIGVGKVLGFELTENFRRPYFAVSVTDFWRRWHISLSTWLKDYVYIPIGGSRCTKLRNYWNIFVTFLVSGVWHGANWTFVVWGIMHGVFQIIEKVIGQQRCDYGIVGKSIKMFITFLLINFAWIFFRMPTIGEAYGVVVRIFDFSLPMTMMLPPNVPFIIIGVGLVIVKDTLDEFGRGRFNKLYDIPLLRRLSYLVLMILIMLTGVFDAGQFIYANF